MPPPLRERLAFSTNAFKRNTLEEALAAIAEAGYAGCEIMADQPHMTPAVLSEQVMAGIAAMVREQDLRVSNVNAFTGFFAAGDRPTGDTYHPTWLEEEPADRDVRIAHTKAAIRLASVLGANTLSLQPGGPMIGTGLSREAAGRRFAEGIAIVLPAACDAGVTLAIEPEPGLFIQTTREYLEWKKAFFPDEPLVRMNFDVGHAFCVGEDPAAVASELAGEYVHVHLEDIADTRVHQHLVPGQGVIDFPELFDALDAASYGGWVTVELYPFLDDAAGVAQRAMKYLSKILT